LLAAMVITAVALMPLAALSWAGLSVDRCRGPRRQLLLGVVAEAVTFAVGRFIGAAD